MRLIRTWPQDMTGLDAKNRIIDDCERVYIPSIDRKPMVTLDDNVIHLDWDVAVSRDDLREFARRCAADPERVRVVPTLAHQTQRTRTGQPQTTPTHWMVWRQDYHGGPRIELKPGESPAHIFSFGLVYLPKWTIQGFIRDMPDTNLDDTQFANWHNRQTAYQGCPVDWDIPTVHLNYSMRLALTDL